MEQAEKRIEQPQAAPRVDGVPLTPADLNSAREDLLESLLDGAKVGLEGTDLETLIDADLDSNPRRAARDLYELFAGIGNCNDHALYERAHRAEQWMKRLAQRWLDENFDEITDRAVQMVQAEMDER